jgi:class 3 adenylate cyclase/predicted ATPase/ABC-type transport system involved in cytochrome c biogenesis ATPase subunit
MEFADILEQTIALLQHQGRISYGALKRRFGLDDAYLDDLKIELIEAQQLARDENGRILVWSGPSAPASPPVVEPALSPALAVPQGEFPRGERRTLEAERRQLTVLFCDLVDSTALAGQLDPEDLREVIRAYQTACAAVIEPLEGHIAQYLGDGLLVYFGYPQAHEDDAQRAGRAGLGMVTAMQALNTHLVQRYGVRVAVRIGIHTGVVVVGEMGGGSRQEQLALGDTPNMAARLQGLAAPDTVVLSAATFRLVQGYFTYQDLGVHVLKGVLAPMPVYRILSESGVQSRLEAVVPSQLTPLVGREEEVALLQQRWEQTRVRQGQVVLLSGEAGIGKSRLVQVLKDHVVNESHARIEWRGSPYHQQSALYPVIAHLQRLLQWREDETPQEKLHKLETTLAASGLALPEVVPLLATLLSLPLPAHYPALTLTPQRQRQKTLETLLTWLAAEARRQPVLVIVEDLHWIDPSTLELLSLLIDQVASARLCLMLTARPEFRSPWTMVAHLTALTLRRFAPAQVTCLANHVVGNKALPAAVLEEVVRKTDGVPLFVEELTKVVLESGLLQEQEDRYDLRGPLPPLAIPATLHDALMARLDRLAAAKLVAQLGAVIGRTFAYDLVQAVAPLDAATLQGALVQLGEAELVAQRGMPPQASYTFKHALIQDVAYQSLLRSTRQQYHERIAQALEAQFPDVVETQPELLAHHYTEAGLGASAIRYWQQAGERALQRSAYTEAIGHLTRGLELLATLPDSLECAYQELDLQIALGSALVATRGNASPEVGRTYARTRDLCHHVGEIPARLPVLWGLWVFHNARADYRTALEFGEQLLILGHETHDASALLAAHRALGTTLFFLGEFARARFSLEQGIALYNPERHHALAALHGEDLGVACLSHMAWALGWLGYAEQARQRLHEALTLAQELRHPYSLSRPLHSAAILHQLWGEGPATQEHAEAVITVASEQGFPVWAMFGKIMRGWALAAQGEGEQGIAQIRQGLAVLQSMGQGVGHSYCLALLSEAHRHAGQVTEGLRVVAEALATVSRTEEGFYEAALHRLKGELLLKQAMADEEQAEACFHQALAIARRQQAKALELHAAMSLARLWQCQGKRTEAYELLAPVYGWFTEGFDTADIQEAKALLAELV